LRKLLIIGPILPPVGGISIHIDRFVKLFNEEFIIDFVDEARLKKKGIFNLRSFNLSEYFRKIHSADIIFIHSVKRIQRYFHLIAGKLTKSKVIFTVHTYPKSLGFPFGFLDRFVFNLANRVIFVNQHMNSYLKLPVDKIFVKHAFLPPVLEKEAELPSSLLEIIENAKKDGKIIIGSNGWKLQKFNGEDMYGLDLCMKAVHSLKNKGVRNLFVFNVSTIEGVEDYFDSCLEQISKYSIQDSFLLLNEKLSFVKLIEKADITVRATNTDGDSLSIRESLFFNKPIIASDVVERPKGVILFKTRNEKDLENKLEECIRNNYNSEFEPVESIKEIKKFYENIFSF
jgi:glycosyltransferase involved in cell wall biosynthesis